MTARCVVEHCQRRPVYSDLCATHHHRWKLQVEHGSSPSMPDDCSIISDPLPTLNITQRVVDRAIAMRTEMRSYAEIAQRLTTLTGVTWTSGAAKHLVSQAVNSPTERLFHNTTATVAATPVTTITVRAHPRPTPRPRPSGGLDLSAYGRMGACSLHHLPGCECWTGAEPLKKPSVRCYVDDCPKTAVARRMCMTHYSRWRAAQRSLA